MKYSVIVLACVLAVAAAQFNNGQYIPENQKQNYFNRYNNNNQFNRYNSFNRYQNYQNTPYKPFGSTVTPRPFFFSSTPVPATAAPTRFTFAPLKPLVVSTAAPSAAPVEESTATVAPAPSAAPVPVFAPVPVKPVITVVPAAVSKYYSDAASAGIVSYENEINPDGSFKYAFQTSNGIAAQEEGAPRRYSGVENADSAVVAQGSFAWLSPEGQDVSITYVADENGYQPSGAAIPQAPEIPALIARALEYIARNAPVSAAPLQSIIN